MINHEAAKLSQQVLAPLCHTTRNEAVRKVFDSGLGKKESSFSISLGDFWKRVFRTLDLISYVFRLDHCIGQIPRANMFERRSEEFSLASGHNVGNNNDHSRVQRFLSMEGKEIGTIVGYKRVVLCTDCGHELSVVRTTETEIIDMICHVTGLMRYFNQGCVQAFIDQELHCHSARARRWRVARIGFRFAQGRETGRPRRGKAWTYSGASSTISRSRAG
jgi:hypothetical protein